MPIDCQIPIWATDDAAFKATDKAVMACAYATHNKLGRLCDEHVYETDLAARLRAEGLNQVHTQVAVTVTFRDFEKLYRLDLVANGVVYELKTVDFLTSVHDTQVYNYAALLGIDRIKLLNFGAHRVEGRLRRAPFAKMDRRKVICDKRQWHPLTKRCITLANDADACFLDWGGFLGASLFEEALIFFNGGESVCVRRLPVMRDMLLLGHHEVSLHAQDVAFVVTSIPNDTTIHEMHLRSLLSALPLQGLQWINVHHNTMRMMTLTSPKSPTVH